MSIARNRTPEERKILNAIMEEAWMRYRNTDIYHILSFEDGALFEYAGDTFVKENPGMRAEIYKGRQPDAEAYQNGRQWMREALAVK